MDFVDEPDRRIAKLSRRSYFAAVATFVLLLICALVPLPYVAEYPGPTVDVLSEYDGHELITVDKPVDTGGPLRMTTVSVAGVPGTRMLAATLTQALLDPDVSIMPREALFPENQTEEENRQISAAQMNSSQENASIAALESMGREVKVDLLVAGMTEGSSAAEVLQEDDVITSIQVGDESAVPVQSYKALIGVLSKVPPKTDVTLTVKRAGQEIPVTVTTIQPPAPAPGEDARTGSLLGIFVYSRPTEDLGVEFGVGDRIGGPSAGLMFALGIIDKLTPGPLAGNHDVAGTGTIDVDGRVGPIGGIRQKMVGAKRDGARYFLIPAANCPEAVGHVPSGMQGIKVDNLDGALAAVKSISQGDTANLPQCPAGTAAGQN
ncbi:MAG: S16 family serine protease [Bowdeniella nasicola]|nr:S16 family serine protease [Bowdeniella nasicola]